ncbi:aspartic proteinase [Musa troglodytarum]|uniref:Aspartic proteinase n=1 Tax=Musa troglodytarum TaxID=320322 RepID=A0A9E7HHS6_9LILI|nr:aspartic proteinase [Musa troglodytarum]
MHPSSQPVLLCSHAEPRKRPRIPPTNLSTSFLLLPSLRHPASFRLASAMVGLPYHVPASKLSLLLHHVLLPVIVVAAAAAAVDGVCCSHQNLLSVHALQWGDKSLPRSTSSGRTRSHTSTAMLEMRQQHQVSRHITNHDDYVSKLLIADEARVSSLQSRISNKLPQDSSGAQVPLVSGIKLQTLNYVATIGVGGKNMTVIVDTGSDLTWVQCKPCFYCYSQQDPLFEPSASPSYQYVPCNSTACYSLQAATGSAGVCGADWSTCSYAINYGDGSYSRGLLGRERIDVGGASIEGFTFGCGLRNHGLFGGTAGLMGLGRTQLSLVSQTTDRFGGVFSYCLPTRMLGSSGSLVLGDDPDAYKNSTPISYTRMLSDPQQAPFYFLNLTDMSVGGVALEAAGFSNGRILIDSGTVITRLVPSVYQALKAEFVKQFSGYPPAPSFSILDTCFDLSAYEEVNVPRLRLGFEGGAEMTVDVTGIFYFVKRDASQVCLAMASLQYEDQTGIIGNYQQKNQRVVYDTVASRIGFAEEACG